MCHSRTEPTRYGGTMLGPVRFTHIENCARDVCRTFKTVEDIEACIEDLEQMDDELIRLRSQLPAQRTDSEPAQRTAAKPPDYRSTLLDPPDPQRARRLVTARRNAIKSVTSVLASSRTN